MREDWLNVARRARFILQISVLKGFVCLNPLLGLRKDKYLPAGPFFVHGNRTQPGKLARDYTLFSQENDAFFISSLLLILKTC